jgi:exopolysaccharide biosynthesis WecB/TagA/CpsF family protein
LIKEFNGVRLLDISMASLLEVVKSQNLSAEYLVTPNIDHFQKLDVSGAPIVNAYADAKFVVCDSRIVRLLSRLEKSPLEHVVPGSDLTKAILADKWFCTRRLAVIGSSVQEIDSISKAFGLTSVSQYAPPMGFIKDPIEVKKCIEFVRSADPEFLFLAVGCPQQEILAMEIRRELIGAPGLLRLMFCVGASFDFLSGKVVRAPVWMQRSNLEWLHRVLFDFQRLFPRYMRNFAWLARYVIRRASR